MSFINFDKIFENKRNFLVFLLENKDFLFVYSILAKEVTNKSKLKIYQNKKGIYCFEDKTITQFYNFCKKFRNMSPRDVAGKVIISYTNEICLVLFNEKKHLFDRKEKIKKVFYD